MKSKIEMLVTILVAVSVIFTVIDYIYELSSEQKYFIYIFDLAMEEERRMEPVSQCLYQIR